MNANEPVAWIDPKELEDPELTSTAVSKHKMYPQDIPLYTHPAKEYKPNQTLECSFDLAGLKPQAKTLTDEEIMVLYEEYIETQYASESNVLGFGRAILRKAQEK